MSDHTPSKSRSAAPESAILTDLRKHADAGDAHAQFELGVHYGAGVGKDPDFTEAASWYRRAADQDHPLAQFNLGIMAARGQGMAPDDLASAGWMLKAAQGGDAGGQYHLGVRCHRASIDPLRARATESRIEGYKWLQLAAAQGYKDSVSAWERLTMTMSHAEVAEGNQRTAAFVPRPRPSDQPAPALPLS